ncbi:MAG: divergent polysaccharide deacetylase family protein [Desulfitobacteriaceae bacterium]
MQRKPIIVLIRKPWIILATMGIFLLFLSGLKFVQTVATGIKDKVIVIDPGHGGSDPGAQYAGLKEKDINLDVALRLRKVLEAKGCKVILTREIDRDFFQANYIKGRMAKRYELNQRINLATANHANVFISIHTNSFPQKSSYGMESYYHVKSAPGKALAERIQKQLTILQPDNKRAAKAGDYYLINQTKMPAVLVEVGFISNARERKLLLTDHYKNSVAEAIGAGINDFFNDYPFGVPESAPAWANQEGPPPMTTNAFKLYFSAENLDDLVTEERSIDTKAWQAQTTAQKISTILQELIKGPQQIKASSPIVSTTQVLGVLVQNGIASINLSGNIRNDFPKGASEEESAIESIVWSVSQVEGIHGVRLLIDGQFGDSLAGHIILNHTFTPQPKLGKVALVIDDFGINNPGTKEMLSLGIPMTAAVMPNLMFSTQEAEQLHEKGYEVILHMPMEAKNARPEWLGPGALKTGLSPAEAKNFLLQGLSSVPYAIGISNHMGSKGTEDPKLVQSIVQIAKEKDLLVLDSKTSESTILAKEARKAGIPTGSRDVFLDNSSDLSSIKKQLRQLIQTAKTNGKAIGIGHVGPQGPNTARAIREMLPEFEAQGIQLVPLSELLQE